MTRALLTLVMVHSLSFGASLRILLDSTVVSVLEKGRIEIERHLKMEILDQRGRDLYGDVRVRYNKEEQDFVILRAVTIRPNGEEVKPDRRAIVDVGDPLTFSAPMYSNFVMKVVSFPALDSGAVIDYHYIIKPKRKGGLEILYGNTAFGTFEPVMRKIFTVTIPASLDFYFNLPPTERRVKGKMVTFTWERLRIQRIREEPNMPPLPLLTQALYYSSFSSWDSLAEWLRKEVDRGMDPEGVSDFAREKDFGEIVSFVKKSILDIEIPLFLSGFRTKKASIVLKNRCGDSKDKAILLLSLLRAKGIQSWPALVSSSLKELPEIPDPSLFDRVLVKVSKEGRTLWIDPLSDYSMPYFYAAPYIALRETSSASSLFYTGFEGNTALVLYRDSVRYERVRSPALNLQKTTARLILNEEGDLRGSYRSSYSGYYDSQIRTILGRKREEERRRWIEERLLGVGIGAKVESLQIENLEDLGVPLSLIAEFSIKGYLSLEGHDATFLLPPDILSTEDLGPLISLPKRANPLVIKPRRKRIYRIYLSLPDNLEFESLPAHTCISPGMREEIISKKEGKSLVYLSTLEILVDQISPAMYPNFRKCLNSFFSKKRRMVGLRRSQD